ncbi:hypothetical protein LDO52_05340 [Acinetobacter pseudolwoffii]|uniref:hypothetical protein n=1 Tax=Acinetobacter pseudolwoffii TaxID=2053287 RepID=UPI001CE0BCB2|nr:hypothetical protein [Acinetobacter pseudolwoffii]UBX53376.1 hypothetical protein LDO52_05340 [Acinetobacter pseudolwoffii]
MLKMPVDENKIESRLRSLSESIALMHIDFAGFFEEYSLKESIDSIMLNYESGSYTSAIKSCSEQSFLIKNNKLIDLYKAEYGKSYFSNLIIESKIVFELNVVISYIAHNLQKKGYSESHISTLYYYFYLLLKLISPKNCEYRDEDGFSEILESINIFLIKSCESIVDDLDEKFVSDYNKKFNKLFFSVTNIDKITIVKKIFEYLKIFIVKIKNIENLKNNKKSTKAKSKFKRIKVSDPSPQEAISICVPEGSYDSIEDEISEDDTQTILNVKADSVAGRVSGYVQSDKKIAEIIIRRNYPTVSNPSFLEQILLRKVFQVLIDKFQAQPDSQESAIAAMFLMSLFTGVSATHFLNIELLLEDQRISKAKDADGYLFRYYVGLDNTEKSKNRTLINQLCLTTAQNWDIHVPASWVDTILNHQNLLIVDLNLKIKDWFSRYCLGVINIGSIAQQLHFHMARIDPKGLLKEFIKNKKIHHEPELAYAVFNAIEMNKYYQKYLENVTDVQFQSSDDSSSDKAIDYPVIWERNERKIGSRKLWNTKDARNFIHRLKSDLESTLNNEKKSLYEKVNSYAIWMWTICLLTLGIRPNSGAPGPLKYYDATNGFYYVHDKKSESRPFGRYIPITSFLKEEISKYQNFLMEQGLANKVEKDTDLSLIYIMDKRKKLQEITADFVQCNLESMNFYLYKNWARHFLINSVKLPIDIQKTLYAHDSLDLGFSYGSSLSFYAYKTKILNAVDGMLIELGLVIKV